MPPRKRKTSSSAVRGPVAVLFMIVVVIIYMFQEWQGSGTQDVTPIAPRTGVTRSIPQAQRPAEDGAIAVFFTNPLSGASSGGIENELVDAINQAQKTIDVAIYNISLPNVTDALIAAFERGVMVRMVMESEAMDGKSPERLRLAGIDMVGDNREGLMHHKFVIIDSQEVWMGSLNFTSTGVYKDFNNLVRIRSTRVAQNYSVEFNEMYVEGPVWAERTRQYALPAGECGWHSAGNLFFAG
jgi:phosphatidylserine/phosphatidylglycerophosphate/cardiolipin synthase-like enzyme